MSHFIAMLWLVGKVWPVLTADKFSLFFCDRLKKLLKSRTDIQSLLYYDALNTVKHHNQYHMRNANRPREQVASNQFTGTQILFFICQSNFHIIHCFFL